MTGKVIPLSDGYPARRPDQVTTFDLLGTSSLGWRANPDTLVGRHGLIIYSKMANDEQVKAVLNFKRDAITARGWQFKFRDGTSLSENEQGLRRRIFTEMVARMRGSFSDALNAIMTGRAYGFSITEKVYGQFELDGKQWPAINMLLGRDPISFRFYTDEYGVLEKIEQQTHRTGLIEVDRRRVIHYVHAPEWDHVYGRSDLREAYRSWYIKDQVSNLWPLYLERFAGGFLHASMAPDASLTQGELDALDEALKKARSLGAIRTPPGVTLTVVHPPAGADLYERALQFHDLAIAKALLVPNLLGISQSSGGSYAQSQTQLEAFFWTLNADAVRLEECLNEQLFRDLGDQAWGDGEYPEFRFKPASVEHVKWVINTWTQMIGTGAVIPTVEDETFLRKLLEMPERDKDDQTIAQANAELAPAPPQPAAPPEGADLAALLGGADPDALLDPEDEELEDEDEENETDAVGNKRTPVGKGQTREFARVAFHLEGQHDQRDHAGGAGATAERSAAGKWPPFSPRAKISIQDAARELAKLGVRLQPAGFDMKTKQAQYLITDKTGHSGKVTGRDLTQYLTGKRDALFVRRFDLAEEVAAQVRTALAKADFHTPGGKEHDQKVHAGDDAAPSETDPKAARVAAAILRKLSPYEAQHRLFRPKQGVDHRAEYDNTVVALHAALTNAGYEVESTQSGRSSSELTKIYRNDEGRIKIEGGSRQIEAQPNMPSAYNNQREYTLRVRRMTRADFHLPGQHDQASHAGGDGGYTEGGSDDGKPFKAPDGKTYEPLRGREAQEVLSAARRAISDLDPDTRRPGDRYPTRYAQETTLAAIEKKFHEKGGINGAEHWLVAKMGADDFARADFHLPGQHDQQDHAGGDGRAGSGKTDVRYDAPIKLSPRVYDELRAVELDTYDPETSPAAKGELAKQLEAGKSISGEALAYLHEQLEYHAEGAEDRGELPMMRALLGLKAKLDARFARADGFARRKKASGPKLWVAFPSAAALEAWLLKLRVGDGFLLAEPHALDDEPASAPAGGALLTITLDGDAPVDFLPVGTRLTVTGKSDTGLEARYDGATG